MKTFEGFDAWHKSKLNEVCGESLSDSAGVNTTCRERGVLPLLFDMSGCFAIRANGEIVSFLYDDQHELRIETDPRIQNVALFQGSKRHPELAAMIPPKPSSALECHVCGGTGIVPISVELGVDNLVCYCGGLGWVPRDSSDRDLKESEAKEEDQTKETWTDWWFFLVMLVLSFGRVVLIDSGVSAPMSLVVAGTGAFLIAYWLLPRREPSFWKYVVRFQYMIWGLVLSVYYLPAFFKTKFPVWLTTSVFILLFSILLYPLERAIGSQVRINSFRKLLLFSFGAAIVIALVKAFLLNS